VTATSKAATKASIEAKVKVEIRSLTEAKIFSESKVIGEDWQSLKVDKLWQSLDALKPWKIHKVLPLHSKETSCRHRNEAHLWDKLHLRHKLCVRLHKLLRGKLATVELLVVAKRRVRSGNPASEQDCQHYSDL
jgi:hypothetical protein